jgi:hypothetical protein
MHLLIFPPLFIAFYQESQPKPGVRFFEYDLLTLNLLNTEKFSLGDIEEGELIKIQVLLRNRTNQKLSFGDKLQTGKGFKIVEPVLIAEGDTGLLRGELQVNSEFVNAKGEFEVGIGVTKESTIFLKFEGDISGIARFEQEKTYKRINRTEMGYPEIRFRMPIALSKDQDLSKVKFDTDPQFAFARFNIVSDREKAYAEFSFPPRMLENRRYQGRIYVSNSQGTIKRSTNLIIERVDDIRILPDLVVFKRSADGSEYVGEAILHCSNVTCDVTDLRLDLYFPGNAKLSHKLEKLRKDTARIYFTITPQKKESFDLKNNEFEIVASDGLKDFDTTFKVFFPSE